MPFDLVFIREYNYLSHHGNCYPILWLLLSSILVLSVRCLRRSRVKCLVSAQLVGLNAYKSKSLLPAFLLFLVIYNSSQIYHLQEFVRQEALHMLQNALEGSGGSAASSAYTESFRLIMRSAVGDKSFLVRIAAARCLKAFALIGGPGLGVGELENSASHCVKAGFLFVSFCLQLFWKQCWPFPKKCWSFPCTHFMFFLSIADCNRPLRILFHLFGMHLPKH